MDDRTTTSGQAQVWVPLGLLAAGLLMLFVRSRVDVPVVRAALVSLAYGSFTLALFEAVDVVRSLLDRRGRAADPRDLPGPVGQPPADRV